jgi:signal transduction histidine kinase
VSRPARQTVGSAPARALPGKPGAEADERDQAHRALAEAYAELQRRFDHRTRQLTTLNAISAVTSQSLDLAVILPEALDKTLEVMGLEAGIVFRFEAASQTLVAVAWRGLPEAVVTEVARLPLADSSAGLAAEAGRPLVWWARDYDPGPVREQLLSAGLVQVVAVPLTHQGQLQGAMHLATGIERPLSDSEQGTLAGIGRQIGGAIANARLLEEAQRAAAIEERQRLARELHDSVTQSLYSLTLLAEASRRLAADGDAPRLADTLTRLGDIAHQALKEMRLLVYELRPLELETEGFLGALRRRLDAVERRSGIRARLSIAGHLDLPPRTEAELYRVVQEVLNNTLKHADASQVTVRLTGTEDHVTIEVEDDGRGFDPSAVAGRGGLGLATMRERAARLGGTVVVDSAPAGGTRVRLEVPLVTAPDSPHPPGMHA